MRSRRMPSELVIGYLSLASAQDQDAVRTNHRADLTRPSSSSGRVPRCWFCMARCPEANCARERIIASRAILRRTRCSSDMPKYNMSLVVMSQRWSRESKPVSSRMLVCSSQPYMQRNSRTRSASWSCLIKRASRSDVRVASHEANLGRPRRLSGSAGGQRTCCSSEDALLPSQGSELPCQRGHGAHIARCLLQASSRTQHA